MTNQNSHYLGVRHQPQDSRNNITMSTSKLKQLKITYYQEKYKADQLPNKLQKLLITFCVNHPELILVKVLLQNSETNLQ